MPHDLEELRLQVADRLAAKPNRLAPAKGVLLYGAGNFGRDVLSLLRKKGIPVLAFIDGKIQEPAECDGIAVYPLHGEKAGELAAQGHPLLLTIHSCHSDLSEVAMTLRGRGFSHILTTMELYEYFPEELGSRYWLAPGSYFLEKAESFLNGIEVWEDELSRDVYRRMLWYRFGWDLAAHPEPETDTQYTPAHLPRWTQPVHLLDGGACEGDALKALIKAGYGVDQLYAWEPDFANFQKLQNYLRHQRSDLGAVLFPCGLGSSLQALSFDGGLGTSSSISPDGKDQVIVLPADLALTNHPVSLIKLDIEGAEADALNGMRSLVKKNKPGLAICVYHRPDDIVQLPRLVRSWNLGYRLYLRIHCWNTFELVMYAFPA